MDKDKLIEQLKAQNKLLRAECKAAQIFSIFVMTYFAERGYADEGLRKIDKAYAAYAHARDARLATEPPF